MGSAFFPSSMMEGTRSTLGLLPKCEKCLLYKGCKSPKMKYSGNGKRKILIIGEAPGSDEDDRGIQFIGESGRRLQSELMRMGINLREDCWLTNSLICRPQGNTIPKDKREKWINYCRPNLLNTLRELNPEIIIPLGATAVQSLVKGHLLKESGKVPIAKWAGLEIPCQQLNAWIVPNYHPAFLGYEKNQALDKLFHRYLKAAIKKKSRPFLKVPDLRKQVEVLEDTESAVKAISGIAKHPSKIVAFDYETTTLRPYDHATASIYCCSLSTGDRTIAYPWNRETALETRKILEDKTISKIGANVSFEHAWSAEHGGGKVRNWIWDGLDGAHILDCRSGITSVKFQGFMNYGMRSWNDSVEKYLKPKSKEKSSGNTKNRIHEASQFDVLLYCGVDSLVEYINAAIQMIKAGVPLPKGLWMGWQECLREKLV